jgi:cytochrome c oxidase subunit 3
MQIPFATKARPDTGLYNGKLGIWLFLASEVMLFGGLFSAYVLLRVGSSSWPHGADLLNVPIATVNTFVLIASSVTMVMAWASLKMNRFGKFRLYMILTLLCGFGFMIIKSIEYYTKFSHHLYPSESMFYAIYFTLTGLHGLHVLGGMIVIAYHLATAPGLWKSDPDRLSNRIEIVGLYWHFVDLVWIFLFPLLYLL